MTRHFALLYIDTTVAGEDVEDLVRDLVDAADGDAELAQYGIIYVDECDKICKDGGGGDSGGGVSYSSGPGARGVQARGTVASRRGTGHATA